MNIWPITQATSFMTPNLIQVLVGRSMHKLDFIDLLYRYKISLGDHYQSRSSDRSWVDKKYKILNKKIIPTNCFKFLFRIVSNIFFKLSIFQNPHITHCVTLLTSPLLLLLSLALLQLLSLWILLALVTIDYNFVCRHFNITTKPPPFCTELLRGYDCSW